MGALPREKERQVEAAWLRHEPERAKVPSEARRAVRVFKASIAPDAAKIKTALAGSALPLINAWAKRGALGREWKLLKIKAALAPAAVDDAGGALLVLWLEPRGQMVMVPDPRFRQNCVIIVGAQGSRVRGSIRWSSFPVFEIPDHALARMFQRSPNIDATAALYEAASVFLHADRRAVEAARLKGGDVCLPCGGGLALCIAITGPDLQGIPRLLARASTWLAKEMVRPDQRPLAAAIDPGRSVLAATAR